MDLVDLLNGINNQNNATNQILLENFEYLHRNLYGNRKHTVFPRINPFDRYDNIDFRRRYRLSKELANQLYELLDGENTLEPLVCILIVYCFSVHNGCYSLIITLVRTYENYKQFKSKIHENYSKR